MCSSLSKIISNNAVKNIVAASAVAGLTAGITLAVKNKKNITNITNYKNITDVSDKLAEMLGRSQVKQPVANSIKGTASHSGKEFSVKCVENGIEGEIGGVKFNATDLAGQGFIVKTYAEDGSVLSSQIDINEKGQALYCATHNEDGELIETNPMEKQSAGGTIEGLNCKAHRNKKGGISGEIGGVNFSVCAEPLKQKGFTLSTQSKNKDNSRSAIVVDEDGKPYYCAIKEEDGGLIKYTHIVQDGERVAVQTSKKLF